MSKTLLVMAGGTGGHIFPGLAVADVLREQGWRVVWMGNPDGMEAKLVPEHGYETAWVRFAALRGKGILRKLLLPFNLLRGFARALAELKRIRPDVVLGMGGFVTFPGGMMAALKGIPLVLHEQNSVAGLANRVLALVADRILTGFPAVLKQGAWVGNPVRAEIAVSPAPTFRYRERQQRGEPLHLLVVGGSLGAAALNEAVPQALALMPEAERPEVVHQAGEKHIDALRDTYARAGVTANLVPFIGDMAGAYAWALLNRGDIEAAEPHLAAAERWLAAGDQAAALTADAAQLAALPATVASARAFIAQAHGDVAATIAHARRALDLLPPGDDLHRGVAGALLGIACWAAGELPLAERALVDAMARLRAAGALLFALRGTYALADIRLAQGRLTAAIDTYEEAIRLAEEGGEHILRGTADLHVRLSELYRERGDDTAAARTLARGETLGEQAASPFWRYQLCLAQARVRQAQGDLPAALAALDAAERHYVRGPVPDVHPLAGAAGARSHRPGPAGRCAGVGAHAHRHHRRRPLLPARGGAHHPGAAAPGARPAQPAIFNTDQGVQFTANAFTQRLLAANVRISMDGRGRALDNVFVERLWRTVKYEHLYLHDYATVPQLEAGLTHYLEFYNHERLHQSLAYLTPAEVHWLPLRRSSIPTRPPCSGLGDTTLVWAVCGLDIGAKHSAGTA